MASVSLELGAWAEEALDLGFGCFSEGDRAPFVLLVEASDQRHLMDLKSASGVISPELLEGGREVIRQFASGQFYALVWDGFLTTAGKRQDAVFAEAGEGGGDSFVFGQRYEQGRSGELTKLGEPLVVAMATRLWGGAEV